MALGCTIEGYLLYSIRVLHLPQQIQRVMRVKQNTCYATGDLGELIGFVNKKGGKCTVSKVFRAMRRSRWMGTAWAAWPMAFWRPSPRRLGDI